MKPNGLTRFRFLLVLLMMTLLGCNPTIQIASPVVFVDDSANCASWEAVPNASSYAVYVDGVLTLSTGGLQYCLDTNPSGNPQVVQVEAIHFDAVHTSSLSTPVALLPPARSHHFFGSDYFEFVTNEYGDASVTFRPHISGLIDLQLTSSFSSSTNFSLPELIRVSDGVVLLGDSQADGTYRYVLADAETYAFSLSLVENPDTSFRLELATALSTDLTEPYSFAVDETTSYVEVYVELVEDGPLLLQIDGRIQCSATMYNGFDWMSTSMIEPGVLAIGYHKTEAEAGMILRFSYDVSFGENTISLTRIRPQTIGVNEPIAYTLDDEWKIYRVDALASVELIKLIMAANDLEVEAKLYYSNMFERSWNSIDFEDDQIVRTVLLANNTQPYFIILRSRFSVAGTFEVQSTWE